MGLSSIRRTDAGHHISAIALEGGSGHPQREFAYWAVPSSIVIPSTAALSSAPLVVERRRITTPRGFCIVVSDAPLSSAAAADAAA